jgi:SRSO17 transposase
MLVGRDQYNLWEAGWQRRRTSAHLADLSTEGWAQLSAGDDNRGCAGKTGRLRTAHRLLRTLAVAAAQLTDPSEVAAYLCLAPADTTLVSPVRFAGSCRTVEICFEAVKRDVALAQYEVRRWTGRRRNVTHAFITIVRVHGVDPQADEHEWTFP